MKMLVITVLVGKGLEKLDFVSSKWAQSSAPLAFSGTWITVLSELSKSESQGSVSGCGLSPCLQNQFEWHGMMAQPLLPWGSVNVPPKGLFALNHHSNLICKAGASTYFGFWMLNYNDLLYQLLMWSHHWNISELSFEGENLIVQQCHLIQCLQILHHPNVLQMLHFQFLLPLKGNFQSPLQPHSQVSSRSHWRLIVLFLSLILLLLLKHYKWRSFAKLLSQ